MHIMRYHGVGTYDVQAVSLDALGIRSVRVTCSFLAGSAARGCHITVCMLGTTSHCGQAELRQERPTGIVMGLEGGVYIITRVADVEEDGRFNMIRDVTLLALSEVTVINGESSHA